jgi:hypothetical protein
MIKVAKICRPLFPRKKSRRVVLILTKANWVTFWASFSQTHPVTLFPDDPAAVAAADDTDDAASKSGPTPGLHL